MYSTDEKIDKRIIKELQNGDRKAFAELYDRHGDWLLAVAYRILQNQRDAEDLLHDVFLEFWRKASSYDQARGTVRSWLAIHVRSRALDRIRSRNVAREHAMKSYDNNAEMIQSADDASCFVEHIQARQAVEKLTTAQRTVIELSYFKGFTCREISEHNAMPLGTVKTHLAAAMKNLRKEFNSLEKPVL